MTLLSVPKRALFHHCIRSFLRRTHISEDAGESYMWWELFMEFHVINILTKTLRDCRKKKNQRYYLDQQKTDKRKEVPKI